MTVERCPVCDEPTERDSVDIGVGTQYGPAFCTHCGWSEDHGEPTEFTIAEPDDDDPFD